jgi:hypothetical protein
MTTLVTFNPRPAIDIVTCDDGSICVVVDDALIEPERLVAFAIEQRDAFHTVDFNAYPGILLPSPARISAALDDFFALHLRRFFDARRVVRMHSRLALVTLPPAALQPRQWICHRDSVGIDPRQSLQASVLYLFRDTTLGGTSFYASNLAPAETARLFHDAGTLGGDEFSARYGLHAGYLCDSNRYFTRVGGVAAKWNRLIFYDGAQLHSGDIIAPDRLSTDPAIGRLSLNGFFTSRRRAG